MENPVVDAAARGSLTPAARSAGVGRAVDLDPVDHDDTSESLNIIAPPSSAPDAADLGGGRAESA